MPKRKKEPEPKITGKRRIYEQESTKVTKKLDQPQERKSRDESPKPVKERETKKPVKKRETKKQATFRRAKNAYAYFTRKMRSRLDPDSEQKEDIDPPTYKMTQKKLDAYITHIAPKELKEDKQKIYETYMEQSQVDRDLGDKAFQEIFSGDVTYSREDAEKIMRRLSSLADLPKDDENKTLLTGEIGGVQYSLGRRENREFWIDLLSRGYVGRTKTTYGSDQQNEIDITTKQEVIITPFNKTESFENFTERQGNVGYYPYTNELTDIDLVRYGIYPDSVTRENCLIHALSTAGIPKSVVNSVKLAVVAENDTTFVSRAVLKQVAGIIERYIKLATIKNCNGNVKIFYYGDSSKPVLELGMYLDHIFINETTKYTKCSIINYNDIHKLMERTQIRDRDNFKTWYKTTSVKDDKLKQIVSNYNPIDAISLIKALTDNNLLVRKDMSQNALAESSTHTKDHIYLENIAKEQRPTKPPKIAKFDINKTKKFYADTETYVSTGEHELYLIGVAGDSGDNTKIFNINDFPDADGNGNSKHQLAVWALLNHITSNGKHDALIYFHNLKYDYFIIGKYLNYDSVCEKGNQIYSIKVRYKGRMIEMRDSYKLLNWRLADFTKNLKLDPKFSKAEAINYVFYKPENNNKMVKCADYRIGLKKKDKALFDELMLDIAELDDNNDLVFNATAYYIEYLKLDCLVLKHGLLRFDEIVKEITERKISIFDCLTISSLTDKYFQIEGAYTGVYETTGNLRKFISEAVYGGRVHCNDKYVKQVLNRKIADYDGVSLYPSAINRLCSEKGLPVGEAVRYGSSTYSGNQNPADINTWKDKFYSSSSQY